MKRAILCAIGLYLAACSQGSYIGEPPASNEGFQILLSNPEAGHDGGIEQSLLDILQKATFSIDCAFQSLNSERVIETLKQKASSPSIRVRVAFDFDIKNTDLGAKKLFESQLFSTTFDFQNEDKLLFGNKGDGRVYYTFCSVDERYNFVSTYGINPEVLKEIPVVALRMDGDQYGIAREIHKEMNMLSQGVFGYRKSKLDFATKYAVLDQVVAIYWAPQENPMDVLGQELAQAEKSVEFYSTSFQTTNNTQKKLLYDVPTIVNRLETLKGKTVKKYFGLSAFVEKDAKVFSLPQPLQYQNFKVSVGTNIFVVDRDGSNPTTFIYTGSLRSRANSSDDGILLELRGAWVAQKLGAYLEKIAQKSQFVSNVGDEASPGAVIISEVMWMGSFDNQGVSYSSDEFIELYNTTNDIINLSGWKFACTTDGSSNNAAITIPAGIVIAPKGYLVIATSEFGAVAEAANLFEPKLKITNSSRECRLGNGRNSAVSYGISNFGTIIDKIGNNTNGFDSATWNRGLNDSTNKIRRSMERTNIVNEDGTKGISNANWRTNVSSVSENIYVSEGFSQATFATPGATNSSGDVGVPGEVVISEVHWMGSYDNSGTGDSDDEFIELYNNTNKTINISGWQFACTTNGTSNNAAIVIPAGTTIGPNSYLVIATKATGAFGDVAQIINSKLKITNSSRECRLGDSSDSTTVYGLAGFGQTIDTIGDNVNGFDSAAWGRGLNDSTNKIRRSMERISLNTAGTANTNWITNLYTSSENNQVNLNFKNATFASPGVAVTLPPSVNPGDVVINEIMWMGSYDNSGTGDTYDEFIELRNKTANSISLANWKITGSGISTITIPSGYSIPANGYFVIARNNAKAFPSADYYTGTALNISNTAFQLELRDSLNNLIDTANNGGAPLAGLNDTTNKIRRSMERRANATDGTVSGSWYTAMTAGTGVAQGFNTRTFATPGQANSFFLTGATATSSTTVTVQFIDAPVPGTGANGAENSANYSISGGLTVSAASLSGNTVTLTTSPQTPAANYTVTVNNVLAFGTNATLSPNTANFNGYSTSAVVKISELNSNITSSCDLIELKVITGGNMSGIKVIEGGELTDTVLITFPSMLVSAGDIIVLHLNSGNTTCNPSGVSNETTSINQFPQSSHPKNYDTAWDVWSSDSGLTNTDNVIVVTDSTGTAYMDAIAISNNDGSVSTAARTDFCAIYDGTIWTNVSSCSLAAAIDLEANAVIDTDNLGTSVTGNSFQRIRDSGGNYCDSSPGKNTDFNLAAQTWGLDSVLGTGACP